MRNIYLPATLAIFAGTAFGDLAPISDAQLSEQTGQDGISIGINIKTHIDAFEWIDTDTAGGQGGAVRIENIALGSGALVSTTSPTTFTGLNSQGNGNPPVQLAARDEYTNSVQWGGPGTIDVADVASFSNVLNNLIGSSGTGTDIIGDGGYVARIPAAGTKAVMIGMPRRVSNFNIGAIRVVGSTNAGTDSYSIGGFRATHFDRADTKIAIWGHK